MLWNRFELLTVFLLFLFIPVAPHGLTGETGKSGHFTKKPEIIQPYEIYDVRFCHLTPDPYLCKKCLSKGMQIARVLEFLPDGRPVRSYVCLK